MLRELRNRRQYIDEPNEYRILRVAREARQISRVEIANRTQLSKATVSEITNRFVESGFLHAVGRGPSSTRGGRKRELLEFNPNAAYVVGIDIERTHTDVAFTNLDAAIIKRVTFSYPAGSSPQTVLSQVVHSIRSLSARSQDLIVNAVGIGVGLPGVIDKELGIIKVADTLKGWKGFNIAATLEAEFHLPVFVENDVKARALGEMIFGAGRNTRDTVYLWLGDGVGAGIVIDGRLHHGFTYSAGEIGYNELDRSSDIGSRYPRLYKKQHDVGELLSEANILRALNGSGRQRRSSPRTLAGALQSDRKRAERVLLEIGDVIGSLCINLVNMLNPEAVFLGGELFWKSDQLVSLVQKKVKGDILPIPANAVRITASTIRQDGVLLGSVGHVLSDLFRPTRETKDAAEPGA